MKKKLIYLGLTGCILFALCTKLQAQIDSLQTHRYVTRATMYGIGFTNGSRKLSCPPNITSRRG